MSQFCENVMYENEKLKILDDLEKIYLTIFNYLNKNQEVNYLKILIKDKNKITELFKSFDGEEKNYCTRLNFCQNSSTEVLFEIFFLTENEKILIDNNLINIKLCLQIFSQSLYTKFMEMSIHKLSLIDQTTGLHNRRYLDNYSTNFLSIANREQKKIAFLKINIDQFKAVIDEFNYSIGDLVLKSLANSLKENIRTSDLLIKMSEDEFLVILMNIVNEENATMVATKLINNFADEKIVVNEDTNHTLSKTICIGICMFPDDASNVDELIRKSDIALYEAKNRGRSKVFVYNDDDTNAINFF